MIQTKTKLAIEDDEGCICYESTKAEMKALADKANKDAETASDNLAKKILPEILGEIRKRASEGNYELSYTPQSLRCDFEPMKKLLEKEGFSVTTTMKRSDPYSGEFVIRWK